MNKAPFNAISLEDARHMAPRACLLALLMLLAIWSFCGLAFVPMVIAPVAGMLAAASLVAYWRFKRDWLGSMPFILLFVPTLHGGIAYALQSVSMSLIFMCLPIWLLGKQVTEWAQRDYP